MADAERKLSQTLHRRLHRAHAARAAGGGCGMGGGKLTVWTGTQRPFGVRDELAGAFGIPQERIRVIVPDTGSGYGGKHSGECAIEAARLAKAAGKPVKLVWTREEEFTWALLPPGGRHRDSSGVRNDGTITAWEFHNYNSGSSGDADHRTTSRTSASCFTRRSRRCARVRIAGSRPRRTISRAKPTWTNWRTRSESIRWSSA